MCLLIILTHFLFLFILLQYYSALNYDDKVVDGFYDLYGVVSDSTSDKMPSLVDLQGTPVADNISWETVLVNRAIDPDLVKLENKALALVSHTHYDNLDFSSFLRGTESPNFYGA
jgi:hypothetical protein